MTQNVDLPKGWVHAPLDMLCQILDSRRVPVNKSERSRRIAGRPEASLYPYYGATGQVGLIDDFIFEGEHILLGEDGAPFLDPFKDKSYLVDGRFWVNNHAHILRSKVSDKYIYYYLNQFDYSDLLTGTTRLKLTKSKLKKISVPVAPITEQLRIVSKIEELFSELDKGVESLESVREQLKVYRQAVLKHAFEGKLTAQWREENKDKLETPEQLLARIKQEREAAYQQQLEEWKVSVKKWEQNGKAGKKLAKPRKIKKLQPFDSEELEKLPDIESASWKWVKVDEICFHTQYSIKAGPFGSALKKQFYVPDGYKLYGQEQVISGDPYYGDYFVDAVKYKELEACKIAPKDVLISLVGTVGKVLILPDNCREGIINPRLVKITLNLNYYRPEFFKYFFESAFVRSLYKTLAKGTTMDVLNLGIIQNLPFPLCSLAEQDKLVAEIESRLSVVDQVEKETEAELAKTKALRLSVLKKAFSGNLVAQNPHDEPASTLLARIRIAKSAENLSLQA
ncbi:MAG: restriction endonuclease subunit S [Gammaproteobacteria bacterium]|nr:restriction endonuclease subunit S [Gammaproteobacteria bacterium]